MRYQVRALRAEVTFCILFVVATVPCTALYEFLLLSPTSPIVLFDDFWKTPAVWWMAIAPSIVCVVLVIFAFVNLGKALHDLSETRVSRRTRR